ncbi:MAG: LysE family transporter [Bacteroidales bacterium]|nr:LysE family transporter [Bacteroidales bacterium]
METGLFLKGLLIGFSTSAPLGPIGVLCVQRSLNKGRLSGFISGMGAAFADTFYAILAGFGLTIIIAFIEERQLYFEIAGIALLFFIGIKIFYANPVKQIRSKRKKNTLFEDFISVALLTLSNPLALFLFLAVFAGLGLVHKQINMFMTFNLVIGVLVGATTWWFILSSLVNIFRERFRLKSIWWINKIAGAIIILFGLFAIIGMFLLKLPI